MREYAGLNSLLQISSCFKELCFPGDFTHQPAEFHAASKRDAVDHKYNAGHRCGFACDDALIGHGSTSLAVSSLPVNRTRQKFHHQRSLVPGNSGIATVAASPHRQIAELPELLRSYICRITSLAAGQVGSLR